ncbi:MAG: hypothetical protein ABIK39_01980 [candidate division WOR-3 bacterium]
MFKKKLFLSLLIMVSALTIYLSLPSTRYNPDGLRVFPSLRYIKINSSGMKTYHPRSWRTGYQEPYFFQQNVHKHLLFPLYAFLSYRVAILLGYQGNGLKPVQIANALSAAVTLVLFALFLTLRSQSINSGLVSKKQNFNSLSPVITSGRDDAYLPILGTTLVLTFFNAFSSMATDIAEVMPAIPLLVLGLLFLKKRKPIAAGIFMGISAAFYLLSLLVAAIIALWYFIYRQFRKGLTLFLTALLITLILYFGLFFLARGGGCREIWNALTFFPEQGTFGGLRWLNFFTVFLGFTNSILPVLPDEFSGVRDFIALGGYRPYFILLFWLFGVTIFLFSLIFEIKARRVKGEISFGLPVLLGTLVSSIFWAPYHLKIWIYANIGLGLILANFLDMPRCSPNNIRRNLILVILFLICGTNMIKLIYRNSENPKLQVAKEIDRLMVTHYEKWGEEPDTALLSLRWSLGSGHSDRAYGEWRNPFARGGLRPKQSFSSGEGFRPLALIGDWEPEFCYLTLYLPENLIVVLPDLILQNQKDSARVWNALSTLLAEIQTKGGDVYFVNLFNYSPEKLKRFYTIRLRSPWFIHWVEKYRPLVSQVWQDERTGIALFHLSRETPYLDQ